MNPTQQLQECFAAALSVPAAAIHDELEYQGIPEWDSMSHMVLMTDLESVYGISLETDDMLEMTSFLKVKDILEKHGVTFS